MKINKDHIKSIKKKPKSRFQTGDEVISKSNKTKGIIIGLLIKDKMGAAFIFQEHELEKVE